MPAPPVAAPEPFAVAAPPLMTPLLLDAVGKLVSVVVVTKLNMPAPPAAAPVFDVAAPPLMAPLLLSVPMVPELSMP
jgi:hypothetical protein